MTTEPVDPITVDTTDRVGVFGWHLGEGGVFFHRIDEPLRVLTAAGVTAFTGPVLSQWELERVDTVLVHMLHTEHESQAWERLARIESHRLIIDVDDAMWAPDHPPFREHYTPERIERLYRNVQLAHVVTTPSEVIAEHLSRLNRNVHVLPNTVPAWVLEIEADRDELRPVVGHQGSPSHDRDWSGPPAVQLGRFLTDHPDWTLELIGSKGEVYARRGHIPGPADRVRSLPWTSNRHDYYHRLARWNVGVGPLRDTPFNRAKSSLRAVEYAALGIVAVLPDLPPYAHMVADGVTGRLVRAHQTMRRVLTEVAADEDARLAMSRKAREVAANWTTEARINDWIAAWESQR